VFAARLNAVVTTFIIENEKLLQEQGNPILDIFLWEYFFTINTDHT
jgi:hypothetical protein